MTANNRFDRARDLFERPMDLSPGDRSDLLDRECGGDPDLRADVESLLAVHDSAPADLLDGSVMTARDEPLPDRIGPYQVKRRLGGGGMGTVFLGEQLQPIRRDVAIKVVRAGLDSRNVVERFQGERQALAVMDHPNIAHVYEASTTGDGRPYFVMEYIDGPNLVEYCDENRLPVRERIRLFIDVCRGMHYAHQKGIIHRDIKPGNILVANADGHPVPKIIDFGIAKAVGRDLVTETLITRQGDIVGTPEYMSPEQAAQREVDTRTDVYSLGVVLYELLSGALPFTSEELRGQGLEAMLRTIRDTDPPRPSMRAATASDSGRASAERRRLQPRTLPRTLSGDLDWITMKAIDKAPDRRYDSSVAFAQDLERYLGDEPVVARPPSAIYRAGKFVRRHTASVVAVTLLLSAAATVAVTQMIQARRIAVERDRANREADSARAVADFLVDLFDAADPAQSRGDDMSARNVVDRGARNAFANDALTPALRGRMLHVLGRVYRNLGVYARADSLLQAAADVLDAAGASAESRVDTYYDLAFTAQIVGEYDRALEYCRHGESLADSALSPDNSSRIAIRTLTGFVQMRLGNYDDAAAALTEGIERRERIANPSPEERDRLAGAYNNLGIVHQRQGRNDLAVDDFARALEIYRGLYPDRHPKVSPTLGNLASAYLAIGDLDRALAFQDSATQLVIAVHGENHTNSAAQLNMLGAIHTDRGNYEQALAFLERAYDAWENSLGEDHQYLYYPLMNMAVAYEAMGNDSLALAQYQSAYGRRVAALGETHALTAYAEYDVGRMKMKMGDDAGARSHLRLAWEIARDSFAPDASIVIDAAVGLGDCLVHLGEYAEAETLLTTIRHTVWDSQRTGRDAKRRVTESLIRCYDKSGRSDAAGEQRAILRDLTAGEAGQAP